MTGLQIADDLALPIEVATDTSAILARKGAGKTYTATVLCEEDVVAGVPFVALDPMGAFWGLRSSADGTRAGLPVTILGGEHGDVPLEPTGGKVVADLVVDTPSFYVLDLSGFDTNAAQDRFATDFAERLYRRKAPTAQRTPLHLIIDEADSFAPQNPKGRERMLGAYEAIARRGRIRGIGSTWITQRPAVLNKNVLTQADVVICLQITSPQDRKAVDEWAKGHSTDEERRAFLDALATLKRGQAWIWAPNLLGSFRQVQIRQRRTWDSSATPKPGERVATPAKVAAVDLDALRLRMAATIERIEAQDPKVLQREIRELKSKLAAAEEHRPEPEVIIEQVEVQVPTLDEVALDELRSRLMGRDAPALEQAIGDAVNAWRVATFAALGDLGTAAPVAPAPRAPAVRRPDLTHRVTEAHVDLDQGEPVRLRSGARRMLAAVAAYPGGMTRAQCATGARLKGRKSGTFSAYLSDLKRGGYLTEDGDLLHATDLGRENAGAETLPTDPDAVLDYWRQHLRLGARRMLDVVVGAAAAGVDRGELAERAELTGNAGTFSAYLSDLRRNGLTEEDGQVVRLVEWLR